MSFSTDREVIANRHTGAEYDTITPKLRRFFMGVLLNQGILICLVS